jgi:hypothetical protein
MKILILILSLYSYSSFAIIGEDALACMAEYDDVSKGFKDLTQNLIKGNKQAALKNQDELLDLLDKLDNPKDVDKILNSLDDIMDESIPKDQIIAIKKSLGEKRQVVLQKRQMTKNDFLYHDYTTRTISFGKIDEGFDVAKFNIESKKIYKATKNTKGQSVHESIKVSSDDIKSYTKYIREKFDTRSGKLKSNTYSRNGRGYDLKPDNASGSDVVAGRKFGGHTEADKYLGNNYFEFDIPGQSTASNRGSVRLLYDGKKFLLTNDHYNSFYDLAF